MAVTDQSRNGVHRLTRAWLPPVSKTAPRVFVVVQFLGLLCGAIALAADGGLPEGEVTVSNVAGAAIAMTGLFLAFVSSRRLGPSMTPSPVPPERARLVMSGPYRYARHPVYGGIFLVLLGTALFLDSMYGVFAAVVLLVFFSFKSNYEERQLRMRFAEYRGYRGVVQRRFIPFVF
jgi:protein-S-isoprenylcysteine O-methyltransferase Ste14